MEDEKENEEEDGKENYKEEDAKENEKEEDVYNSNSVILS